MRDIGVSEKVLSAVDCCYEASGSFELSRTAESLGSTAAGEASLCIQSSHEIRRFWVPMTHDCHVCGNDSAAVSAILN